MAPRSMLLLAATAVASAEVAQKNPLGTVLSLIDGLAAKVVADGEAEAKAYKEYFEWCDDASMNKNNDITTAKSEQAKLEATLSELTANIESEESTIADLAAAISTSEADLKAATEIREKENVDFLAMEKELADAVDTLGRAITVLQREMQKNPAAFAQVSADSIATLLQSIGTVIEAAGMSVNDKQNLTALLQQQQQASEDQEDAELGAPAASVYKTHSGSIFDVLEDMKEKAEGQLAALRKAESTAKHNFEMLKQSLEDQLSADNTHMAEEKASKAANEESKATAEGDLSVTLADLKASQEALATANSNCMQVAADHEATVQARDAELKVIAEAKEILKKTSEGAVEQTYSLLQTQAQVSSQTELARSEVLTMVKKLAREYHSSALAQLASKMTAITRFGSGDPFAKIKGLIQDMIAKLEAEAQSEATEKAYCDEELSKSNAKKDELDADIASLTTKIDQAAARSGALKSEVKELQSELATMAKEQADNEKWRIDEHEAYVKAKADLELGLSGVRQALDMLRSYYGAAAFVQQPAKPETFEKSSGAGGSIIDLLEVCESDFANNLAKEETEEADAQSTYETYTQEYKITKAKKEQDVKYKTQEFTGLDKTITELSSDRVTESSELAAVEEYLAQLKDRCIAKPETYEDRSSRRNAEIAGLKEALSILENEAALVQRRGRAGAKRHHNMRGSGGRLELDA